MTVSVLDHGAMGDGVTDDRDAVQAVIDAAPAGETILFPADRAYLINTEKGLQIPRAMTLDMRGATLPSAANQGPRNRGIETVPGVGGCVFLGGRLVGTPLVAGQGFSIGLRIDLARDTIVDGMEIVDWSTDGIYIGGNAPSVDTLLGNVVIERCTRTGVVLSHADGVSIKDSFFRASAGDPGAGINSEPNEGEIVSNVEISDCAFDDNRVGVYIHPGHGEPPTNFRVIGNRFTDQALFSLIANGIQGFRVVDNDMIGGAKGMTFGSCSDITVASNLVQVTGNAIQAVGVSNAMFFGNDLSGGSIVKIPGTWGEGFLENVTVIDFTPPAIVRSQVTESLEELELIAAKAIGWKDITEDGQLGKPPKWLLKASGDNLVRVKITLRDLGPIQSQYGISLYSSRSDGVPGDYIAWRPPFSVTQPARRTWALDPVEAMIRLLVDLEQAGELNP